MTMRIRYIQYNYVDNLYWHTTMLTRYNDIMTTD